MPDSPVTSLSPLAGRLPKKRRAHWYRVVIEACPVCGRSTTTRQRVYGKRPRVRHRFVDSYDYCDV